MEHLEIGKIYNGFKLNEIESISYLHGTGFLFEHVKSGATLLFFRSEDTNKVFNATFRTLPNDDTGSAHIVEHALLCGSQKYNVKDPFNELLKGSLHTFLNAMTYSDKTMYPIATTNNIEFMNLTDVYLDAVFNPNLLNSEPIFMQEGVRYQLSEDSLEIGGVVYNEMKGASSSVEYILAREVNKLLLNGSIYSNLSGGSPDAIEHLTYEELVSFYKEYYHPSNSFIYAFGDIELFPFLTHLDNNYLSKYSQTDDSCRRYNFGEISANLPPNRVKEIFYPISLTENSDKRSYLSLSFTINNERTDLESAAGLNLLRHMLTGTPASPLKNALIDSGICEDVYISYDPSAKHGVFSIVAKNASSQNADLFKEKVHSVLQELSEKDFNRDFIEGIINIQEFSIKEQSYGSTPRGLMYAIAASSAFVNGWDILPYLSDTIFNNIKAKAFDGYFKSLIQNQLLQNDSYCLFVMNPVPNLQTQKDLEFKQHLHEKFVNLTPTDKEQLTAKQSAFDKWQKTEDPPENTKAIPILKLEDLSRPPILIKSEKEDSLIVHYTDTNEIVYCNIAFSLSGIDPALYSYCALLCAFIEKCDTKNAGYVELGERLLSNVGNFSIYTNSYSNLQNGGFEPKIIVKAKMFENKLEKVIDIINDLLCNALFVNDDRILTIIAEEKSNMISNLTNYGYNAAILQAMSCFFPERVFYSMTRGIDYYLFLDSLSIKPIEEIKQKLHHVYYRTFTSANCFIGTTVSTNSSNGVLKRFTDFYKNLPMCESNIPTVNTLQCVGKQSHAFITPAKNNSNVSAANYFETGQGYSGKLSVLVKILEQDYLWNNVRVKGGAYGCGTDFFLNGCMFVYSMRDPNINETYSIFDGMKNYLESFNADERELTRYIIGAGGNAERPLTTEQKNDIMTGRFFSQITDDFLLKMRLELLSTTAQDIRLFAPVVDKCMSNSSTCTVGNRSAIESESNSTLFSKIHTLL